MNSVSGQSDGTQYTHYALTANTVIDGCIMYNNSPLQTKKVEAFFYPMLHGFLNGKAF